MGTMAKPLDYNSTLVERQDLTPALTIFKIDCDEELPGSFVPGQYMTLGLNNEEVPELGSVRRPMSIASAPEEEGGLEFYIRYVNHPESDNPLTHLLWKTAVGDRLYMRPKAVGKFTVSDTIGDDDDRLRILVAAGTGLAPFVSMVRSHALRNEGADLSRWAILHGASYPDDLGYREELEEMAEKRGLIYGCTISRPHQAEGWQGDAGRVEDYFKSERLGELEERLGLGEGGLRPDKAVIYICGLQGTIGKTLMRLAHRGFVPENRKVRRALEIPEGVHASLFFEQYDSTPVIPVDDEQVMSELRGVLHAAM